MKIISFLLFTICLFVVPAFGQMGIINADEKLYALEKSGKFDEAIADINERIKIQPNNGELYLRRAAFLKLQNKLDEAIDDISNGIEVEPDNASFYIARAEYLNLKNDSEAVLKDVKTAVSLAPNNTGILVHGAQELTRGKQFEENIKLADFCIARSAFDNDSADLVQYYAYKIRGENKFVLEDYAGALEDSIAAINFIRFTGDDKEDFQADAALYKILGSNVILQTTQNHLKDNERIFDYYNRLFDALQKKVELLTEKEVSKYIETAKRIKPNEPIDLSFVGFPAEHDLSKLMLNCAALYIEKNRIAEADKLFKRIVELKLPAKWLRYKERVEFYIKLKNYQAAIDDLTFIISDKEGLSPCYPTYVLYLNQRARLYEDSQSAAETNGKHESAEIIRRNRFFV